MKDKKHIITIAGRPGSGKSTASKAVAAALGYQHFSSGDLFRSISASRGLELIQSNLQAEKDTSIDDEIDEKLRTLYRTEEELVIDSRMAWHWMPGSLKVYLDLDLKTAAERVLSEIDLERMAHENIPKTVDEYAAVLQERLDSEARRYLRLYQVNPYDTANYDIVIDTLANDPDAVVALILEAYKKHLASLAG